jgi:RHS repeat-associated protein
MPDRGILRKGGVTNRRPFQITSWAIRAITEEMLMNKIGCILLLLIAAALARGGGASAMRAEKCSASTRARPRTPPSPRSGLKISSGATVCSSAHSVPLEMGGRRHFHLDHLGTPRLITSDNAQLVSYHDYYPFGDEKSSYWQEGPSAAGFDREEPMKFTGHERDFALGMGAEDGHAVDYMHTRYYSPTVGRFLSVDPVLGKPEQPQSWNRYAYVMNNPINRTDPTGLAEKCPPPYKCAAPPRRNG